MAPYNASPVGTTRGDGRVTGGGAACAETPEPETPDAQTPEPAHDDSIDFEALTGVVTVT